MNKWLGSSRAVREMWRLDRYTLMPEKVRVLPVAEDYLIVEGDDHTSYAGGFFDTIEEAYARELEDIERSIKSAADRKKRLLRAKERALQ